MPSKAQLRHRRLQSEAYLQISRIHRVLERRVAELFVEVGLDDVTPAQANVLTILFNAKEPMTARALARAMSLSEVTVGRFVRALESAGWLSRTPDPNDSRAMLVSPTRKAYRAFPKFLRVSNTLLDEAFGGFAQKDIERIAKTTIQLRENLEGDGDG